MAMAGSLLILMGLRGSDAEKDTGIEILDMFILALPVILGVVGIVYVYMKKGRKSSEFNLTMLLIIGGSAIVIAIAGLLASIVTQPPDETTTPTLSSGTTYSTSSTVVTTTGSGTTPATGGVASSSSLPILIGVGVVIVLTLGLIIFRVMRTQNVFVPEHDRGELVIPEGYHVPFEPVSDEQMYILERYWHLSNLMESEGAPSDMALSPREFEFMASRKLALERRLMAELTRSFEFAGFGHERVSKDLRDEFEKVALELEKWITKKNQTPASDDPSPQKETRK